MTRIPAAELQKAIFAALTVAPALCDGRIYDNPPDEAERIAATAAAWPYLTIGDDQIIDGGNSCGAAWEAYPDVHIWTLPEARSKLEAKSLAADVVERLAALEGGEGFAVIVATLETFRTMRDPDGITEHGVVTMRYLLEPT